MRGSPRIFAGVLRKEVVSFHRLLKQWEAGWEPQELPHGEGPAQDPCEPQGRQSWETEGE